MNSNKVTYLADYISQKKSIVTLERQYETVNLIRPRPMLFKRSIALMLDIVSISLIKMLLHTSYALFVGHFLGPLSYSQKSFLTQANPVIHISTFVLIYYSYFLFCTYILDGKTLGKLAMGLRVVKESYIRDPEEQNICLDLRDCFRRATGYLLCYLSFGTFFIFNFSSEDKRGLADYLSQSRTVSDHWLKEMQDFKTHQTQQVFIDVQSLDLAS